jgi:hypothetical protein
VKVKTFLASIALTSMLGVRLVSASSAAADGIVPYQPNPAYHDPGSGLPGLSISIGVSDTGHFISNVSSLLGNKNSGGDNASSSSAHSDTSKSQTGVSPVASTNTKGQNVFDYEKDKHQPDEPSSAKGDWEVPQGDTAVADNPEGSYSRYDYLRRIGIRDPLGPAYMPVTSTAMRTNLTTTLSGLNAQLSWLTRQG